MINPFSQNLFTNNCKDSLHVFKNFLRILFLHSRKRNNLNELFKANPPKVFFVKLSDKKHFLMGNASEDGL